MKLIGLMTVLIATLASGCSATAKDNVKDEWFLLSMFREGEHGIVVQWMATNNSSDHGDKKERWDVLYYEKLDSDGIVTTKKLMRYYCNNRTSYPVVAEIYGEEGRYINTFKFSESELTDAKVESGTNGEKSWNFVCHDIKSEARKISFEKIVPFSKYLIEKAKQEGL